MYATGVNETGMANLPPQSMTIVPNLLLVSTTPAVPVANSSHVSLIPVENLPPETPVANLPPVGGAP